MENEIIFVIEESEEGGWTAKALGYSIFTEGDSINELKSNIREAISCHFDDDKFPKNNQTALCKR